MAKSIITGLIAVLIFLFVDGGIIPEPEDACMETAHRFCTNHYQRDHIFCTSDGHRYHGLCAFYTAFCKNHITVVGHGSNCTHPTRPPARTRPPPTQFEINLFKNIIHGIDDRLALSRARGIPVKTAIRIFSTQDHTHKVYVRNKDCWAYGLDLTSISPWNSDFRNKKAGTLISPRHVLWARHYSIHINKTIRFVDANNNVVERRVVSTHMVNKTAHDHFYGKDIVIGVLDKDVPSTIGFARVMPREIVTFRPPYNTRLPVLSTDQEEKALVADFSYYSGLGTSLRSPIANSTRHDFFERKIGGDSGNPSFFVINQELVLLFVFTSGGAGGGTNINHWYDEINRIMELDGSGYQLTEASLRGFLDHQQILPTIIG